MVTGPNGKSKVLGNLKFILFGVVVLGLARHLSFHRLDELYTPFFMLAEGAFWAWGNFRYRKGLRTRASI